MDVIAGSVGQGGKNNPADVKYVQTALDRHEIWLAPLFGPAVTGICDAGTVNAITAFQASAAALLKPDGVVSPHGFTIKQLARAAIPKPSHPIFTQTVFTPSTAALTPADYAAAAKSLACEAAAIQAVAETETKQAAFDAAGRPTILYERRIFRRLTRAAYAATHPDISSDEKGNYGAFSAQYPKLTRAAVLDEQAALQSASWGAFQIVGEYYAQAGFGAVADFVTAMMQSQRRHLDAFVAFIAADAPMLKALQTLNWAGFARLYNGPDYATNAYDTKMAQNYAALAPPAPPAPKAAPPAPKK